MRLAADGTLLEERSMLDMLRARPDVLEPRQRTRDDGLRIPDLLHANYLHWFADPALAARDPFYAEGRVLVTLRNQDAIVLFDWARGEAVWAWGPGELGAPQARVEQDLDDGRVALTRPATRQTADTLAICRATSSAMAAPKE